MGIAETIARHATDRAGVQAQAARLLESRGPLIRAEMERRINARTQNDLPTPPSARYTEQAGNAPVRPSEASQGRTARTLPALDTNRVEGPRGQQQQPLQQQRTNVGGVGVQNRMLISGDNADEAARMRAAQDEIDSVIGSGRQWTREDALRMHNELGGVNIPPANPAPRLEVSDANFQFRQDFLDHMDAKTAELDATGKNTWNVRPFAELFSKDAKLGDLINPDWDVFKYYPSLRDMNLRPLGIFDAIFGTKGAYDNATKTMFLPRNLGKGADELEDVRSTILHEVQHYIQGVEGWARGGNPEEFKNLFRGKYKDFAARRSAVRAKYDKVVKQVQALPEVERFNRLVDEAFEMEDRKFGKYGDHGHPRKEILQAIGVIPSFVKERFLTNSYEDLRDTFLKFIEADKKYEGTIRPPDWSAQLREQAVQILEFKRSLDKYTTIQEQIRMAGKIKKLEAIDSLGYEGYQKLFGEIEARQAQERMNMTDAERAATPQEIMNIDPNETIVRQQNQELKGNIVPGLSFEQGHIVFHGGPISAIDKFMLKFLGTGEGVIARGWGFYFAERPGISAGYREARADEKKLAGGIAKEDWDWRSQVHTSFNGTKDVLFHDTENNIIGDNVYDSHFDVYSQFKANFIGLLGSELESLSRRLKGDFSNLSEFQRADKLFKIIEEANDMTVAKLTSNTKFYRRQKKEAPDQFVQSDLDQNMAALTYAGKFKSYIEDSEVITQELQQIFENTIKRYEEASLSMNLKEDAGLFVIDLKANQHADYLHLDEYIPEQSTKIQKILKKNIEDKDLLGDGQNGEFLVKTLEGMYGPQGLDDFQFARFTEEGKKALVRAFRTTLDTSSGTDNNRWAHRKFASLALKEMGIPGSAHYDRKSRWGEIDRADKTNNYVIWDEDIIEQLAVQPYSWRDRGHLEVDPTDHPLTDEYKPK